MLKAEHITKQYQIPGGGHTVFDAVSDVSIELEAWPPSWERAGAARAL